MAQRGSDSTYHEEFMRRALVLARRGREQVSPNPMVGAVLVRRGRIVAEGYHRRFGGDHAEVDALRRARSARGADLYVTLEPCGHQGKTPPCSEAVIAAGIGRVFFGARDPNPATAGKGPRSLKRHGIPCRGGVLERECTDLNAPFFHWIQTGLPWVILKWAMTLDGKTATVSGDSRWITGEPARAHAHALRRRVDGILVGTNTALDDDPELTPRPARGRRPARIVLDWKARLPLHLRLLGTGDRAGEGPRLYVTSPRCSARRRQVLESRGLELIVLDSPRPRRSLRPVLEALGRRGISQLMVEGGATLAGSLIAGRDVQEVAAYVAPRIAGGREARGAVEGPGIPSLEGTPWISPPRIRRLGRDILITGRLEV
jgi:diaminohydroxyphosphoribosylaminopyrimidine deaminase/5-amino-6-(5-phosphoribosylamino)uracil reductase